MQFSKYILSYYIVRKDSVTILNHVLRHRVGRITKIYISEANSRVIETGWVASVRTWLPGLSSLQ